MYSDSDFLWFTPESERFMRSGQSYLTDAERLGGRAWDIIDYAATLLGDRCPPQFREVFARGLMRGWCSLSTPIWMNFGKRRGLPISCVTGDTWVNTRVGGGKQARDIAVGDEVLTHRGRYRKVAAVIPTKGRGDIYRLKVVGRMTPLHLTGDHPVLTNLGWVRTDELNPLVHMVATNRAVEHVGGEHVIDMRPYCQWPVVESEGRLHKAGSEKVRATRRKVVVSYAAAPFADIKLTAELGWALGVWFAEGSLTRNKTGPNGIRITLNARDEKCLGERWLKAMSDAFGVNGSLSATKMTRWGKGTEWLNVNLNSLAVGRLFESFGNGCKEKVAPEWLTEAPIPVLSAFLDGLLAGDGHTRSDGVTRLTLSNPRLVLQAYQIALKLGRTVSLQMQMKSGPLATTKYVYTLLLLTGGTVSRSRSRGDAVIPFADGLGYSPIREVVKTDRVEDVFDFTVEEDHSFSAAGVVVHNCYNSMPDDSMESIMGDLHGELAIMSKNGGGTSVCMTPIRGRGAPIQGGENGTSSGSVHFAQHIQSLIRTASQGKARRGNVGLYWHIRHPDIREALKIRTPGFPVQDVHFGVVVDDAWLEEMVAGDQEKRQLWAEVLKARRLHGEPYILFEGNMNRGRPQWYVDQGLAIESSNLCTEVTPTSNLLEAFVCCLMSLCALTYDEWKDTDFPQMCVYFLDAVITDFLTKARGIRYLERAVRYAERHRSLGIGLFGWHDLLQSRMLPFDSPEAMRLNAEVFRTIRDKTVAASEQMAKDYGEPEVCKGYGRRHALLQAVAPTKSSAFIIGQASESVEPRQSNYVIEDKAKGKFTWKNPHLKAVLAARGHDTADTWKSILAAGGSVQHLACLSEQEKEVFLTALEIPQMAIVRQAAQRQQFIDQAQSVNLFVHASVPAKDVNALHLEAWRSGVKTLYYLHNENDAKLFARDILSCSSCEA